MNLAYNFLLVINHKQYQGFSKCTLLATPNRIALMQDKDEVQHQISILLFIGMACGVTMMVFTRLFGSWALTGNKGSLYLASDKFVTSSKSIDC